MHLIIIKMFLLLEVLVPTHDDITASSIAKAFNRKLILNKKAKSLLEKHYKKVVLNLMIVE